MREVEEWIAKHDDQAVPRAVRVRIFDRYEGRCYLSGRQIRAGDKWELEHIKALCNGGEHRESNLAPALVDPHKVKTKADRKIKAKIDRVRKKHLGLKKSGRKIPGSKGSGWRKTFNHGWVKE
jgi:5-methylcytosine-specific restriction endonuclease McrA